MNDKQRREMHPIYAHTDWNESNTLRKLLFFGMAGEEYDEPLMVTIVTTRTFEERIRQIEGSPRQFIRQQFRNHDLHCLPHVGVWEFGSGRYKPGDNDPSNYQTGRLHVHMIVDAYGWDRGELKIKLEKCFRFGRNDSPAHQGRPFNATAIRFEPPLHASLPFRVSECGGPGWLIYATKNIQKTREFFKLSVTTNVRIQKRNRSFENHIGQKIALEELFFSELIFYDSSTLTAAKKIHSREGIDRALHERAEFIDRLRSTERNERMEGERYADDPRISFDPYPHKVMDAGRAAGAQVQAWLGRRGTPLSIYGL